MKMTLEFSIPPHLLMLGALAAAVLSAALQ